MLKPPASTIPGMNDTLEFVKSLWGGMNVPGAGVPGMGGASLSTDDLDKRIADLKAVESWLNMNTTMLRTTIQALEVQRGTLATLKSMSANMAQAMGQAGAQPNMAAPFAQFFTPPAAQAAPQPAQPAATPKPKAEAQPGAQASAAGAGAEAPSMAAGMPAAIAWWNLLQDQFKQAVTSAMSPEAMAGAAAMAQDAAARSAAPAAAKPGEQAPTGNGSTQPGAARPRPPKPGPDKG
jgi:hypothetical protein